MGGLWWGVKPSVVTRNLKEVEHKINIRQEIMSQHGCHHLHNSTPEPPSAFPLTITATATAALALTGERPHTNKVSIHFSCLHGKQRGRFSNKCNLYGH